MKPNLNIKNIKKNILNSNPYMFSYLTLAMLCCICISIILLYINIRNLRENEQLHNQTKLTLITEDLETQFSTIKDISLRIQITPTYDPTCLSQGKYYQIPLLEDFSKYINFSPIMEDYILYYHGYDRIFHSSGNTTDITWWKSIQNSQGDQNLIEYITQITDISYFIADEHIFMLYPIFKDSKTQQYITVLAIHILNEELMERIQMTSGGLNGMIAVYAGDQLLASNTPEEFAFTQKNVLSASAETSGLTIYFKPSASTITAKILPLELLAITAVCLLMLSFAYFFANRSYRPIIQLTHKYRQVMPNDKELDFVNELETLNHMMESVISENVQKNIQLQQKQQQLRTQMLLLLLHEKYPSGPSSVLAYLPSVGLHFPGPIFFTACVSFREAFDPASDLAAQLIEAFSDLSVPAENKFVYPIPDQERNIIHVLCSIMTLSQREEIRNELQELSENFDYTPVIGCGNVYNSITNLSASHLEALDDILSEQQSKDKGTTPPSDSDSYQNQKILSQIYAELSDGHEDTTMELLTLYARFLEKEAQSLLIQQYRYNEFFMEIKNIYHEHEMELSKKSLSLILAANNIDQFLLAAQNTIQEFCAQLALKKSKLLEDKSLEILQYMKAHFTDYDLSIEEVARENHTTPANVRSAIQKHTGLNYVSYLIYLRIEHAKYLLTVENHSVAETCQKVGYGNISYFIKVFKTHTGMTPSNYKETSLKELRQEQSE